MMYPRTRPPPLGPGRIFVMLAVLLVMAPVARASAQDTA